MSLGTGALIRINFLWPCGAISHHSYGSTLDQVMAAYLPFSTKALYDLFVIKDVPMPLWVRHGIPFGSILKKTEYMQQILS